MQKVIIALIILNWYNIDVLVEQYSAGLFVKIATSFLQDTMCTPHISSKNVVIFMIFMIYTTRLLYILIQTVVPFKPF